MKAAQLVQYGGKEAVLVNDIPKPDVPSDKILVEVRAAGVNPFDWKIRKGMFKDMIPLTLPVTLGGDFAGVVAQVGAGVSEFGVGDEVYGQANVLNGGTGSFAEFDLANPKATALKPKNLSFALAAVLPLAGVSAMQALFDHMNLSNGQKILIHGGAGGIGSIAIQIAKHVGLYVATTVRANDMEYVKGLRADLVIDYKSQKFEDVVKDYNCVFDTVGGNTYNRSFAVLKKGGVIVSMLEQPDEELMEKFGAQALYQGTQVTTDRLQKLAELVDGGAVNVHVENTFPLTQAGEALSYLEETPPKGKIVIKIH